MEKTFRTTKLFSIILGPGFYLMSPEKSLYLSIFKKQYKISWILRRSALWTCGLCTYVVFLQSVFLFPLEYIQFIYQRHPSNFPISMFICICCVCFHVETWYAGHIPSHIFYQKLVVSFRKNLYLVVKGTLRFGKLHFSPYIRWRWNNKMYPRHNLILY